MFVLSNQNRPAAARRLVAHRSLDLFESELPRDRRAEQRIFDQILEIAARAPALRVGQPRIETAAQANAA